MSFTRGFYNWVYPRDPKDIITYLDSGKEALYCYNNLAYSLNLGPETDSLDLVVRSLENNTTCKALVFGANMVETQGCRKLAFMLKRNSSLRYFSLGYNEIGDQGAAFLASALKFNRTLVGLSLVGNNIGDSGAHYIASALAENTGLSTLNLSHNLITSRGVEFIELAFRKNYAIIALDLRNNMLEAKALENLNSLIARNRKIQKNRFEEIIKGTEVTGEWNRAKIVIVGEERVGKTATKNSLLQKSFSEEWNSTVGIEVSESRVSGLNWNEIEQQTSFLPSFAAKIAVQSTRRGTLPGEAMDTSTHVEEHANHAVEEKKQDIDEDMLLNSKMNINDRDDEWIIHTKNDQDDLRIAIFDFGGQKVFHSLHQLFFTPYAFYLLVFDASRALQHKFENVLFYWLNTIQLHSPNAHIAIVGTFADDIVMEEKKEILDRFRKQDLKKFNLVRNLTNAMPFYLIDNKTSSGVIELRETFQSLISRESSVRVPVPIKWIRCLDLIISKKKLPWLKLDEVKKIAKASNIQDYEEVDSMLTLFHELGCLLYFNRSSALREFITIHPQWMINAIAKVIFDSEVHVHQMKLSEGKQGLWLKKYVKSGILTRSNLRTIWDDDKVDFLLEIMESAFLLCKWEFITRRKSFFVPSMILKTKEVNLKHTGHLFRIQSHTDIPMGLYEFLQCLCIAHSATLETREPKVYSRAFEVYFENKNLLRVDAGNSRYIDISITNASEARRVLSIISAMLRKIKDEILGNNLLWSFLFLVKGKFISYQEAKSSKLEPWFLAGGLSKEDEIQLEAFMKENV